ERLRDRAVGERFPERQPGKEREQTRNPAEDERDELVLRQARADEAEREERGAEQQGSDVAADDRAEIEVAVRVHDDREREREQERDREQAPRREELAEDERGRGDRRRGEDLPGAKAALVRPQPHREGRREAPQEPRHPVEEAAHRRFVTRKELLVVKEQTP